ncbi:hypothetical protein Q5W_15465 [Hydrogenophaga sp. PBC]|uniref:phage BR0599 family protein n=1 Tax=Hydrogenophaga sp. PBC TaxID=795665 RepID=UPI0002606A4A|nr:phage BR0599 family protein [Hydrogenophaga sp. PBC]AOS80268.1 hypothetical protein Q5W_15465 [Hydrogenophaga sp. PBC]
MTVPATPRRAGPYDGTGAQTAFGFSFKAFDEADVRVVELDEPTNVESDAALNTDYTVALNPDQESTPGGTVNYLVAPSADKKITLIGNLDFAQPVDLPDGGNYRAQQVEDGLDRLAICLQQLKEITNRCAQVPVSQSDAEGLIDSINVLSANLATLQTVVTNIADLITLANDIDDVALVATISADVQVVAAIAVQVVAVAAISPEIVAVDSISADVQTVAANMASILAAVADLPALAGKANSGAVTASLLTMATARFLGRVTASVGALEELTAAQALTLLGFTVSGAAPLFAPRAWVNFNGSGTVAIRASGNVSSITDNGVGAYPYGALRVRIVEVDEGVPYNVYRGSVRSCVVGELTAELTCTNGSEALQRLGLRLNGGRQCQWSLYSPECGVAEGPNTRTGTVVSVSADGRTVETTLSEVAGFFKAGRFKARGQARMVTASTGGTLTLFSAVPGLAPGDAIEVSKGCDRTMSLTTGCGSFSNVPNFSGFDKFVTPKNVFSEGAA